MRQKIIYTMLLHLCFVVAYTQNITRFEYFIDTDPGVGNATSFIPTPADSITVNIPYNVNTLTPGHHRVGIRSLNSEGKWSFAEFAFLYVETQDTLNLEIARTEFFIGNADPGTGSGKDIVINTAADSVTVIADTILNNLALGDYKISIRFKDNRGVWGHSETKKFTVCATYGPKSFMTYQVEGNSIFFTNNSENTTSYLWKFGDNSTSTVLNPIKTYAAAGNYNLQLITNNSCGADTLNQAITIRGLQRVNANKAGNAGVSTLMFEGFGFTASTDVKLVLGGQVFTPASKTFLNSNRIRAHFNFTGFATGTYRAMATLGGPFDTLNNAFTITEAVPVRLTLDASNGRSLIRPSHASIEGTIRNNGSQDAIMVPYVGVAGVLPGVSTANMNPFVSTDLVPLLNEGVFQHTYQYLVNNAVPPEVMFEFDLDSARKKQIIAYYKTRIPANASTFERTRLPHNFSEKLSYQTSNVVLGPLLDSYALMDSVNTDYKACYSEFLKQSVEKQLGITVNDANWNTCFDNAFDTVMRTLANISQNPTYSNFAVPMQAGFSALLSQMAACGSGGVPSNLGGIQFKRVIQDMMNNWIYLEDIDSLDQDCIDPAVEIFSRKANNTGSQSSARIAGVCEDQCDGAAVFPEMCDQCLPLILAGKVGKKLKVKGHAWGANSAVRGCKEWCETNSIDPNTKYGPGNNTDRKYINHISEVSYRISFENLASATAPAAYVEIRDTIDRSVYDISTFRLGAFSWGDSIIVAESNEQNVSILKNIKPTHPNFLRIDATTDTAAGIITWKFWTIDTVNLQLTTNAAEGFLPPNTDGVKGAGYVTFNIAPLSTAGTGTILRNKATIIFDQNAPITTDEWEYRIDTLKPSSAVNSLPAVTNTASFLVEWGGTDAHAGIDKYMVLVSINDSVYKVWQNMTEATSATYTGEFDKTYKFISVALDKASNFEDSPNDPINNPDAQTTLSAALPLQLISFTGKKVPNEQKTELTWKTVDEVNVSHFEIQRSADGTNYAAIATVPATNSTGIHSYSLVDNFPIISRNFYRLKIIDRDGQFKYSNIVLVRFDKDISFEVYPTLVHDNLFIQTDKAASIQIIDMMGRIVKKFKTDGNTSISVGELSAGPYVINNVTTNQKIKIVKY